ncbi:hypothetical protein ACN2WE_36415 [Streptomyces sp. cg28]|uniref:hypothetical protein n=1 Tax=unclassified Streptomyces TaxID=2593676 RepID=UPI000DC44D02|nr:MULTISPECIES: hypothetical protein [unclassified Streptomyces]MYT74726.1 hypothetical protein [Streptomyces sp. SID8367]RAJ91712.1 hypothetical protein K377_00481 [Streptomyces sp. PsTaAH-137]
MYGNPIGAGMIGGAGTGALAMTGLSPLALLGLVVGCFTLIAAGLALRSLTPVVSGRDRGPGPND